MTHATELATHLEAWSSGDGQRVAVAEVIQGIAAGCLEISALVSQGALAGALGATTGRTSGVDPQKKVDILANDLIIGALSHAPVAAIASEELELAQALRPGAPLIVAIDPIDGSSNIDTNAPIGTIFSVLPAGEARPGGDCQRFIQPGSQQLAAGLFVYGPQTVLALTVGAGTDIFTLDKAAGVLRLTHSRVQIPPHTSEYAINASNYRHWDQPVRTYIDDCLRGAEGPRGKNFNMRWTASPVADIYRILSRGGIFLYPGDLRDGYGQGRLRLVYEANAIAWVVEQAGGAASTGRQRILDLVPERLHQHVPVVAGSREEVDYVIRLHLQPFADGEKSPLFGRRGLFRN